MAETVESRTRIRKVLKRLQTNLTRIRRNGEVNDPQKMIVEDAFARLGGSTQPNDHYQKLLREVHTVSGLEMVALCALSLAGTRLKVQELVTLLPPRVKKKASWTCFALERLVREQSARFPHLRRAAAPIKWVLMPRRISPDQFVGYIDYDRRKFQVHCKHFLLEICSFSDFVTCVPEPQSAAERYWWERSTVLDHGARGHVRQLDRCRNRFPVLKISGADLLSQQLIRHEFRNLRRFQSLGLPIVEVCDRPLKDEQGIIGFRMEKLSVIPSTDNKSYLPHFKTAVAQLHAANVVHGDLWFGNFMVSLDGSVKLIDFSHSGLVGEPLPPYHRDWKEQNPAISMSKTIDLRALQNMENLLVQEE